LKSNDIFKKFELDTNLKKDLLFLVLFSMINHFKKNPTLKNWLHDEIFENLTPFYTNLEIKNLIKILKKSNLTKSKLTSKVISEVFQKNISEISYEDILKILPKSIQKKFAIYYTKADISLFIAEILKQFKFDSVFDPACGNGRLLDSVSNNKRTLFGTDLFSIKFFDNSKHKIIENMDFLRIDKNGNNGKKSIINQKFDLVIMNPPYTRFSNLNVNYRESILSQIKIKPMPQMGLHGYFILHSNNFLNQNGLLVAVLPASILFSKYAHELRLFLLNNFSLKYIISYSNDDSFSDNSSFKEIILIAKKNSSNFTCNFISIPNKINQTNYLELASLITHEKTTDDLIFSKISKTELSNSSNWLSFFYNSKENNDKNASSKLKKFKSMNLGIRRGTESFGPEFFYLPNKYWKIEKKTKKFVKIFNSDYNLTLEIPNQFLIPGIIRTKLNTKKITLERHDFFMSIPPLVLDKLPISIQKYIEWGSTLDLAIKKHSFSQKNPWYSFLFNQLQRKSFFGNLLLIRKLRLNTMSVIAHFNPKNLPASKAYYIIQCPKPFEKIIAAWLNSTYFLKHMLNSRRRISNNWGELMISDILELECVDPTQMDEKSIHTLESIFDKLSSQELPNIVEQEVNTMKKSLDEAIIKLKISS
jgi:tRNA1(Val) A37 N6-methylase TrmN6